MLALGANGLPAERVGVLIHTARAGVRYAIVPNPLQMSVLRLLPKRVVNGIFAKRLGLTAPKA